MPWTTTILSYTTHLSTIVFKINSRLCKTWQLYLLPFSQQKKLPLNYTMEQNTLDWQTLILSAKCLALGPIKSFFTFILERHCTCHIFSSHSLTILYFFLLSCISNHPLGLFLPIQTLLINICTKHKLFSTAVILSQHLYTLFCFLFSFLLKYIKRTVYLVISISSSTTHISLNWFMASEHTTYWTYLYAFYYYLAMSYILSSNF